DGALNALFNNLAHGFAGIELRLLLQKTNAEAGRYGRLSLEFLIDAGKNAKQRTLSRAVEADHADLRTVKIREVNVLEDSFLIVILAVPNHGVNDFVGNVAQDVKLFTASVSDSWTSKTVYNLVNCRRSVTCRPGLANFSCPQDFLSFPLH